MRTSKSSSAQLVTGTGSRDAGRTFKRRLEQAERGDSVPARIVVSVTLIAPGALPAPEKDSETVPALVPRWASGGEATPIVSVAGLVPDAGVTVIQGWLGVAVQGERPAPGLGREQSGGLVWSENGSSP